MTCGSSRSSMRRDIREVFHWKALTEKSKGPVTARREKYTVLPCFLRLNNLNCNVRPVIHQARFFSGGFDGASCFLPYPEACSPHPIPAPDSFTWFSGYHLPGRRMLFSRFRLFLFKGGVKPLMAAVKVFLLAAQNIPDDDGYAGKDQSPLYRMFTFCFTIFIWVCQEKRFLRRLRRGREDEGNREDDKGAWISP